MSVGFVCFADSYLQKFSKKFKHNQYNYFNSFELKCWDSGCPDDYYSNEINTNDNLPIEDITGSNCVKQCSQSFPKHDYGLKVCKKDCGSKYYTIDDPNTCIESCNETYPYISENNEKLCLRECHFNKFIIEENNRKKCVSSCKEYNNSYFITGDQKCYGKCPNGYNYINEDNNECLILCLYNTDKNKLFSKNAKCVNNVGTGEYFYESDKIILDSCPLFYDRDNKHCHDICPGNVENSGSKYYCGCSSSNKKISKNTINIGSTSFVVNECVDNCQNYYIKDKNQCIDQCPYKYVSYNKICYNAYCKNGEIFDTNNKECISKDNQKYLKQTIGDDNNFEAYIKVEVCEGQTKYIKDSNDQECVSICPQGNNYYKNEAQNIMCKKECDSNEFYISLDNNLFECVGNACPNDKYTFYEIVNGEEVSIKLCSNSENDAFKCILDVQKDNPANNKTRYSSCPSRYKFNKTENGYKVCYPDNPCSGDNSYYFDGNCLTGEECKEKNRLYIVGQECVDECSKRKIPKNNIYECSDNCNTEIYKYIDSGDYCVEECPKGKNYIGTDNYCKSQCESSENYRFFKNYGEPSYPIYLCISGSCEDEGDTYKYSGYNTNQCFEECNVDNLKYLSEEENKCYSNCLFSEKTPYTLDSSHCFKYCENKFYYDKEKKCENNCKPEDYAFKEIIKDTTIIQYECIKDCSIKGLKSNKKDDYNTMFNMCVETCEGNKPYVEENFCKERCPDSKKYFDKDLNNNIECLTDCPDVKPYYSIYDKESLRKLYGCQSSCNNNYFKVINYTDTNLKAILCIPNCPDTTSTYKDDYKEYKYRIRQTNNNTCYAICPYEKPYHINDNNGADCLSSCSETEDKIYQEINDIICKKETECNNQYIDFEDKLCLSQDQEQCPSYRKYTTEISNGKYICSDTCEYSDYTLSTPYNTCVKDCNSLGLVNGIDNSFEEDCFCENLYYINDSIKVACFERNENLCKKASERYRIKMSNSKECVQTCNGSKVLSLWEDICYDESYDCNNDENTKLITQNNGQKKCDCQYRFYYTIDTDSSDNRKVKVCMNQNARCHDEGKNRFVPETLECVDDCPDEFKYVFQDYFCLRDCPKDSILKPNNVCECEAPKKFWHKITSRTFECLDTCHDKYPVYAPSNNRCLNSCKNSYFPYFYENKCYRNCNKNENLNIVNAVDIPEEKDLYDLTCKCKDETTWYRNESNTIICSEDKKDCQSFDSHAPFKYLIFETWECVDECPDEYPYFFNNYCFKNCNSAASILHVIYDGIFECQCNNLWYNETSTNSKICIDPEIKECILYNEKNLKYKINSTNECVEKCPDEMYEFNYICYDKCPENTKDNKKDKTCSCNTNMGYWYEYERGDITFTNKFLECGVEECPENIIDKSKIEETRQYLLKEEKKCLKNCGDYDKYNYHYICVEKCPTLTKTEDYDCKYYKLDDQEIENRTALKDAANVQAYKLYNESVKSNQNEFFFDRFNVSIHIYGVDPYNSYKDLYFGSDKYQNLTYIDFSTCLNKLFLDKNFSPDEKILIAKYDIHNNSYLINQVEYELFSNKTNEKLDALVCAPYEICISYPLNFSKYKEDDNENEYLTKFNYGKDLYSQDSTINSFDFNSPIYKNFCRGVEINGKDLVFEDRYEELYPNKMLLCENNCTMKNTDFELKRINCFCKYKGDIDFDRKEEVDDIFNNPNYYIPTQSPANAEVIKCLSNFTIKQTIIHNEAFYFCSVVIAVEIALTFISSYMGINTITNFMKPILSNINNKNFDQKTKEKKNIGFKEQNIISTTNRPLNNPPKRNNIEKGDDNSINNEDNFSNGNNLDNNNDKPIDYEINIKKGNKDANNKSSYNSNKFKAEFIPFEYNTKFFKQSDKGVMKKIDRSKLPFKISSDTQYLVEKRKDVDYGSNYLNGAFYPSQNILIITDGTNNNIEKIVKHIKTEKMVKNDQIKVKENNKLFEKLNTNYSQNKEKDFITVKKIKPSNPNFDDRTLSEGLDEDSDDMKLDEENAGLFTLIKREQLFLRLKYNKYLEKKHPNNLSVVIAEILDKIYIVKICLFLRKYDIFTHQLSLYVFCHLLLFSLLCGFFTVRVIKKIWKETNYPGIGFYILYGLISNIIIWIIYQIFLYILDFRDKIKEIVSLQKELKEQELDDFDDNIDERNEKIFNKKYKLTIRSIKCTIAIFYIAMFAIILFCTIYLISFFALYTGTKKRVLKAYYISLILIVIIKFVYGFSLGSLRIASRINKIKTLYKVVYIFDKYIS